jgi:type II secretory pathway component PulM
VPWYYLRSAKGTSSTTWNQTHKKALFNTLNNFLAELNKQGVDIVSVFDVNVDVGSKPGVINVSETKKVAIVKKSPR